ncbi:MAG: UDP-N-acetylmuramate dehydrogenase [Aromatoleum sp.]|jgi:UDP-N-acetylmuramate dehydrogenase|uniref:UDP-N-acetylmuramate dehydrogenase n=1 Tax=Aromatoleum sp. TaxID=2307007 RepID=UPI0028951069|nr:UDP-N-acetylmuramate dehydrogenase [Aromatoleum sp.]MDT3669953.1 UDP-N-acetylmuramate dehydrogenase [Aromatoleum sp.]
MPPRDLPSALPRIEHDADLQSLNTFGLPARARQAASITDAAQLAALAARPDWRETPRLVLGGGSNVILTGDFDGLVLKVAIPGRRLVSEDADAWYVEAGAGENWHEFVRWTLDQGWPGLENLSLIPGTVGAAPIQNIGAYGLEIADRFHALTAVPFEPGPALQLTRSDCRFGYRDSVFKHEMARVALITSVIFRLPKHWQPVARYADLAAELDAQRITEPTPRAISDAVVAIRRRKLPDPAVIGNAGSFFKNPIVDRPTFARLAADHPDLPHYPQRDGSIKLAAGWLIERAGWKGRSLGPVGAFERQALVLVNRGGATGTDVRRASAAIQRDVADRFGVRLEPEPVFV